MAVDDGGARRGIQRSLRGRLEKGGGGRVAGERMKVAEEKITGQTKTKVLPKLIKVQKILIRFEQIINNQLGLIILITSTKNFP